MRPDLFFCGAVRYTVALADAPLLLEILQEKDVLPKSLGKSEKSGKISFFLSRKHAQGFEDAARSRGLAFLGEEKGVHVLGKRFLRAPGMIVGVLLSFLLLAGARTVVWDIRITGNDGLDVARIEDDLAQIGLYRGVLLSELNADEIALSLRQNEERVGYAAVNIEGTVVHVQIRENEPVPAPNVKNPANLVATRDGVITLPLIFEGECLVEQGEVVRAGQILAGGLVDTQNFGYRVTRAAGQVFARTVHTYRIEIPFAYEEKVYTGEKNYDFSLLFFHIAQKVFKNTGKNDIKCDIIEKIEWMRTPTGALLPFGYRLITAYEYAWQPRVRTLQEARALAEVQLQEELAADAAGRTLLEKHVEWCVDGEGVALICTVVCEEDIARTLEFTLES